VNTFTDKEAFRLYVNSQIHELHSQAGKPDGFDWDIESGEPSADGLSVELTFRAGCESGGFKTFTANMELWPFLLEGARHEH